MAALARRIQTKLSSGSAINALHNNKSIYLGKNKINLKEQFDRDGYVHIKNALNPVELSNLRQWTTFIEHDAFNQKDKNTVSGVGGLHHFETDNETKKVRITKE